MVIATFGPSTGWVGKTIRYENGRFILEGRGVISAADVLRYDREGHLSWAYAGLQEWVQQVAATPHARPSGSTQARKGAAKAPRAHKAGGTAITVTAAGRPRKKTRLVAVVVLIAAVLAVSGALWVWPAIQWSTADTGDLIEYMADTDAARREEARQRLVEKGDEVVASLQAALTSENATQRVEVTLALLDIGSPEALTAAVGALGDRAEKVSAAAEAGLLLAGDATIPALVQGLENDDAAVRAGSARLLGEVGGKATAAPLMKALGDDTVPVRMAAAEAVGKLRIRRAAARVVRLLGDSNANVRFAAEKAVQRLGPAATKPLLAALRSRNVETQAAAARACGSLRIRSAAGKLVGFIASSNGELRSAAVDAVKRLGTAATDPLLAALRSPNAAMRTAAAKACGVLHVKPAAGRLADLLREKNPRVKWAATNALVKLGAAAVGPLSSQLGTGAGSFKWVAASILVRIARSDPDAVKPLLDLMRDGSVSGVADRYAFFIRLGHRGSEGMLIKALDSYGNATMCVDYLNCGNDKLDRAGRNWAQRHGYSVSTTYGTYGGPTWGSGT